MRLGGVGVEVRTGDFPPISTAVFVLPLIPPSNFRPKSPPLSIWPSKFAWNRPKRLLCVFDVELTLTQRHEVEILTTVDAVFDLNFDDRIDDSSLFQITDCLRLCYFWKKILFGVSQMRWIGRHEPTLSHVNQRARQIFPNIWVVIDTPSGLSME